jgi:6-phosphogluconolactonase (cycloisomerase 2 family)
MASQVECGPADADNRNVATSRGGRRRRPAKTVKRVSTLVVGGMLAVFALVNAPGAAAAPLEFVDCVANGGEHGCAVAKNSLRGAESVVVSPDGHNVYVASYFASSITVFHRHRAGKLAQVECLAEYRQRGCSRMPHGFLLDALNGLAISPDGRDLYAASDYGLIVFARASDGSLSFESCVGSESDGCRESERFPGEGNAIAISHDGHAAYAVSDGLIAAFSRAPSGRLRPVDCVGDPDRFRDCKAAPFEAALGASTVTVSPDDRSVYVGGFDGISSFHVHADGTLALRSCIANRAEGRCSRAAHPLGILWSGVAAPGQGDWVYAASLGDTITVLAAGPDGSIAYHGCVTDHTRSPCAQLPDETLLGTDSMVASPNGAALYVGGATSVLRLRPHRDGGLTFEDCVADKERDRPRACASTGNDSLQDVRGVAASPSGNSIYAASSEAKAVVVLGG